MNIEDLEGHWVKNRRVPSEGFDSERKVVFTCTECGRVALRPTRRVASRVIATTDLHFKG